MGRYGRLAVLLAVVAIAAGGPLATGGASAATGHLQSATHKKKHKHKKKHASSNCDPNYTGACLNPNSPDYDCAGGSGNGPDYTGPVRVVGNDHFGLDRDGDGYACENS
jgi:hypothetical protein